MNRVAKVYNIDSVEELPGIASAILKGLNGQKILAFYGEMGAGKTALIKQLCHCLEVEDKISSPTYSLVNEYKTRSGQQVFHFDFYRVTHLEEVFDIGYEMYFDSGNYCFIEWAENVETLLPQDAVKLEIGITGKTTREITVHLPSV